MANHPRWVLSGLSIPAGVVLFLVVNVVVGLIANPLFPNQSGPMPANLPYFMLGLVLVLVVAAVRSRQWRLVALGFALGFVGMTAVFRGRLTRSWFIAAARLDPTREPRRLRRQTERRDSAIAAARPGRIEWVRSEIGRALMARDAFGATACAFGYRDRHPDAGFATSLREVWGGARGCRRYADPVMSLQGGYLVSVGPQQRRPGEPVASLSLTVVPHPETIGVPYPRFEANERGVVTVRLSDTAGPHIVASPVPALLQIRGCLLAAPTPSAGDSLPSLKTLLRSTTAACATLASGMDEEHREKEATATAPILKLCVGADSQPGCRASGIVGVYGVRYERAEAGPSDAFILHVKNNDGGPIVRRYLVTASGTVHATGEARDATEADPLAEACEIDPGVPCR